MPKFTIPIIIECFKEIEVEADSLEAAVERVENGEMSVEEYISDWTTLGVDYDCLEYCNPEEKEDA